jgi:hypothetical protein
VSPLDLSSFAMAEPIDFFVEGDLDIPTIDFFNDTLKTIRDDGKRKFEIPTIDMVFVDDGEDDDELKTIYRLDDGMYTTNAKRAKRRKRRGKYRPKMKFIPFDQLKLDH